MGTTGLSDHRQGVKGRVCPPPNRRPRVPALSRHLKHPAKAWRYRSHGYSSAMVFHGALTVHKQRPRRAGRTMIPPRGAAGPAGDRHPPSDSYVSHNLNGPPSGRHGGSPAPAVVK